ncbi:hypothetical protein [Paenibacillus montanisoli]|uniref:DUF4309 domain-containing protein n=1 Tax=Paenibacillus montanisoli TaxID=2081970 RepID=A0A328U7F3_9BACL|nr:hypothetical protein [Paenibacillus montanisoli]RAP78012.1 hypothetical protein DL346_06055 [Paenibacillus montanisoli]
MMKKINIAKKAALTAAACTLLVLLSSCRLGVIGAGETIMDHQNTGQSASSLSADHSDSPQKSYAANDDGQETALIENAPSDSTAVHDAKTESSSGKTGTKQATAKEELKWDAKAPKLHGIAIGDAKTVLDIKLGKHSDSYSIDDGEESIAVLEYAGFSVGYGPDKRVKFVEVFEKSASTGLSGLRVGDSESAVTEALGKPSTHTSSVLAYKANGALLKLDLDPQNKRVLSIKLFLL